MQRRPWRHLLGLFLQPGVKLQKKLIAVIVLLASTARGQELTATWFEQNYLPAAAKLEKAYGEASAVISRKITSDNSSNTTQTTIEFAFDGLKRKFDTTTETFKSGATEKWSRTIVAAPEVSFSIYTKQGGTQLLDRVNRSGLGFAQAQRQIESAAGDSIYAPFALLEHRVSQWIKDKGFTIKRVSREGDRVRLDFQWKSEGNQYDGWIGFLPKRQWVIHGWDIRLHLVRDDYTFRIVSTMTYGAGDPVPTLTGSTAVTHHRERTDNETMKVEKLAFVKVADDEFKLSRYGYDDRIGSRVSVSRSLWFWLAVGGTVCLIAAFVIRQILSKRAAV